MKKTGVLIFLLFFGILALGAKDYSLNESESVNLDGIEKIVFTINKPNCVGCFNSFDIDSRIGGNGTSHLLELSLEGKLTSNRDKAIPNLKVEESGKTLRVSLYPEKITLVGLVSRGLVSFDDLSTLHVNSSSGNLDVRNIRAQDILLESSSGDQDLGDLISYGGMELYSSTGDVDFTSIESRLTLAMKISSGNIEGDSIKAGDLTIQSSSGNIEVVLANLDNNLTLKASSGRIDLTVPAGSAYSVNLDASSGRIRMDDKVLGVVNDHKDVILGDVNGGGVLIRARASSGNIRVRTK